MPAKRKFNPDVSPCSADINHLLSYFHSEDTASAVPVNGCSEAEDPTKRAKSDDALIIVKKTGDNIEIQLHDCPSSSSPTLERSPDCLPDSNLNRATDPESCSTDSQESVPMDCYRQKNGGDCACGSAFPMEEDRRVDKEVVDSEALTDVELEVEVEHSATFEMADADTDTDADQISFPPVGSPIRASA
jgi:hypothetical protein